MAAEFLGKPFMGPPSVPHVNEDFFKMYFLGAHVSIKIINVCMRTHRHSYLILLGDGLGHGVFIPSIFIQCSLLWPSLLSLEGFSALKFGPASSSKNLITPFPINPHFSASSFVPFLYLLLILFSPSFCSRDYVISVTDEAAKRRQARRGVRPTTWTKGRPLLTDHSWERMFNSHLHWKRWAQERMGPYYSPV